MNYALQDTSYFIYNLRCNEGMEIHRCCITGDKFYESELIFDAEDSNYFLKSKFDEYMETFRRDMLAEDWEAKRLKLSKQL